MLRAFRRAGIDADRARGALVRGLRHTFATELANSEVSVYTLMKLLGHESMVTSQRYVTTAGTETRNCHPAFFADCLAQQQYSRMIVVIMSGRREIAST